MRIVFLMDFQDHKAGDVVDVPEANAEDHHQAGRAFPYVEPKPEPEAAPKEAPEPKKVPVKRGRK